jgi:hypothetical protein
MRNWLTLLAFAALLFISTRVQAELPPGSYDTLRVEAPEALLIEVLGVKKAAKGNATEVVAMARVLHVERTKAGLRPGAMVEIRYIHLNTPIPGPRPVPLLAEKAIVPAFLKKGEGKDFEPAAYGMSFVMTPER